MIAETGPEAFVRQLQAIIRGRTRGRCWRRSAAQRLLLVGDADVATPPELNKEIADGIPGAKLTVIPDSGHLTSIEQPEAVNAALAGWLGA